MNYPKNAKMNRKTLAEEIKHNKELIKHYEQQKQEFIKSKGRNINLDRSLNIAITGRNIAIKNMNKEIQTKYFRLENIKHFHK